MPGIATQGVMQSVLLKPTGDRQIPYQIVDGDRRMASAIRYGLKEVPALITDGSRGQIAALSAILNASRGPNILDEARSWQTALEEGQFHSIGELAAAVHVSEKTIKTRLRLMELPESLLDFVGVCIAPGVAMSMAKLDGQYRTQAIMAAEAKMDAGEKFTAADLKNVTIRRVDDRARAMDSLFAQEQIGLQPTLLEIDPVKELAREVIRLAQIQEVQISELIPAIEELSRNEEEGQAVTQADEPQVAGFDLSELLGTGEPEKQPGAPVAAQQAEQATPNPAATAPQSGADQASADSLSELLGLTETPAQHEQTSAEEPGLLLPSEGDDGGFDLSALLGEAESASNTDAGTHTAPEPDLAALPAAITVTGSPGRFRPNQRYT